MTCQVSIIIKYVGEHDLNFLYYNYWISLFIFIFFLQKNLYFHFKTKLRILKKRLHQYQLPCLKIFFLFWMQKNMYWFWHVCFFSQMERRYILKNNPIFTLISSMEALVRLVGIFWAIFLKCWKLQYPSLFKCTRKMSKNCKIYGKQVFNIIQ